MDPARAQALADTAYEELCLSGHYSTRAFAAEVDDALRAHGAVARRQAPRVPVARVLAAVQGELERRASSAAGSLRTRKSPAISTFWRFVLTTPTKPRQSRPRRLTI